MIVSLILLFLIIRFLVKGGKSPLFLAVIGACALQGAVISLNQHYGLSMLRYVQPITASLIPPLAYVTFQMSAIRNFDAARDLPHVAVPLFVGFCMAFAPQTLDFVLVTIFAGYGLSLLILLARGSDSLLLTRLESGESPIIIWRVLAIALLVSAFSDILIIVDQYLTGGQRQSWIISVFSSLALLTLGVLSMSRNLDGTSDVASDPHNSQKPVNAEEDQQLLARLDTLLREHALYLNPGLTLSHLARRLHIPAKQLSGAINRTKGMNVSRYINTYRIDHACALLAKGDTVTAAMLESGFNTKSNFNREFRRTKDCSPTEWLNLNEPGPADKPALR